MDSIVEETDFSTSANFVTRYTHSFLQDMGVNDKWIDLVNLVIVLVAACIIVYILEKTTHIILSFFFKKVQKITKLSFFKHAKKNRLPHFLALIAPYAFVKSATPTIFDDYQTIIIPALKAVDIYMVFMVIWTLTAIVKSLADGVQKKSAFRNKPMKSYLQVIQIVFYLLGIVVIFSIVTGKSATIFFTAMGAASAVLLLIFKDAIMGFVSSIQISTNEMVMLGDWITMSKYGADGEVLEINLTTVKVRNFDKTITTIPTYALISDSFQNWRGMQESGGRRIKQAIYVKQSGIRMLGDKELSEFEKVTILSSYIKIKRKEYQEINTKLGIESQSFMRGFGITNCDLFLQYATWYLRNNPDIHQDMTLIVRQLAPTTQGLPIEVYAFANNTALSEYERTASEVLNHLISSVGLFGLTIFEITAGSDSYDVSIQKPEE